MFQTDACAIDSTRSLYEGRREGAISANLGLYVQMAPPVKLATDFPGEQESVEHMLPVFPLSR